MPPSKAFTLACVVHDACVGAPCCFAFPMYEVPSVVGITLSWPCLLKVALISCVPCAVALTYVKVY